MKFLFHWSGPVIFRAKLGASDTKTEKKIVGPATFLYYKSTVETFVWPVTAICCDKVHMQFHETCVDSI